MLLVGGCWLDEGPGMCHVGIRVGGGVRGETRSSSQSGQRTAGGGRPWPVKSPVESRLRRRVKGRCGQGDLCED